jgi:hypothetical protein
MSKKINAFGLIEVLIALLLVSSTLILAIRSVSQGLKISKENEIRDTAGSILIRSLEYKNMRLPEDVSSALEFGNHFAHCYKLDADSVDQTNVVLTKINANCDIDSEITNCSDSDQYRLQNVEGLQLCNQIRFTNMEYINNVQQPLDRQLKITSTVVYYVDGEPEVESMSVYRNL